MWLIIFGVSLLAGIIGVIYLVKVVSRFSLIEQISKRWQRNLVSFLIIAFLFAFFMITMGFVNAFVILFHVLMFSILFGFVGLLIGRFFGKAGENGGIAAGGDTNGSRRIYLHGWLTLAATVITLVVGFYQCYNVWKTEYNFSTDKIEGSLKIAMIADSHVGTTFDGDGFAKKMDMIMAEEPDILLIAGDFVDYETKKEDMVRACKALGDMKLKYGVWYAYGNHDADSFGRDFDAVELENELVKNGVHVLKDEFQYADNLCIVGRKSASSKDRMDIADLLSGVDESKYIVVLSHEPVDYENECKTPADLVLSGHTHGGQMIPITYVGVWSGINDRTYGYESRNDTDFIVTSGISDWAIDFKTGTKSEYVIIDINN